MAQSQVSPRFRALEEVRRRAIRVVPGLAEGGSRVAEHFGSNTFDARAMREKLPRPVFKKLQETTRRGEKLDRTIADTVAHAVKEWALEKGCSHFCHWFQPQTGLTAEKHDAFLTFDDDAQAIERFSGSQLIQSEPDASSFPSGGMRTTFEARGYTAWDPSSPVFVMEGPNGNTLCIPSVFLSYYGQALDNKTPLLRSMEVLNRRAVEVLKLLGHDKVYRVVPTLGPEQEYFLIDRAFYDLRPDLVATGRTLVGARPAKGQQLEDHYFGSIKGRILAFMQEAEHELYKLGVPVKTRHNEVSPAQYESAPIFEEANVASDHNQLVMEILRSVARRHDLTLLLHEKPFAGVNGSGKHNNWSLADSEGNNLLEPGKTPDQNLQFLVFLVAVLKGVHKRAGLLRSAIAISGNDHRLGANEAPPAIISVFLGEQLTDILDRIEKGEGANQPTSERLIQLGVSKLPEVNRDYTDRNRTSPFAFTGNKFEFRAVPSSAVISVPIAILNAAVAEALEELKTAIEQRKTKGMPLEKAVMEAVREAVVATKPIRYEGNNYAAEWVLEAERRKLPNLRKAPEALAQTVTPESKAFFARTGLLREEEVEARYHVMLERYVKDIEIEYDVLKNVARTLVLPAAFAHQETLGRSIAAAEAALPGSGDLLAPQKSDLKEHARDIATLAERLKKLERAGSGALALDSIERKARAMADEVLPAMEMVREVCDRMEENVADDAWPLPKYREMLFVV
ncbi:MAG: glutamine synthetase III [Planctomycetes bacterium]|nr:glutamine synthetase III [Planctomycetota bacterium]